MKILVSDPLGKGGMDLLRADKNFQVDEKTGLKPEELKKIIGNYEAILAGISGQDTTELDHYPFSIRRN